MNELKLNDILKIDVTGKFTLIAVVVGVNEKTVRLEIDHEHYQNGRNIHRMRK